MTVHRISKFALLVTSLGLVSFGNPQLSKAAPEITDLAQVTTTVQASGDEEIIRARLSELTQALTAGDAKAEASLWTEDGMFVDDSGKEWKGRTDLEQRFTAIFAEDGKQLVDLVPKRIRMLSSNVALAQGVIEDKTPGADPAPITHFSIMFLKQDSKWLISMATETPLAAQAISEPLKPLDWLIGEWTSERNGKSVHIKYQWMANKNFIHVRYGMNEAKDPEKDEVQIIGWDPRNRQIISWGFDANGGFAHSIWFKKDNQWLIDKTTIGSDGSMSRSTHILANSNPDSYSWQSVSRTVDGVSVPDTAQLIVQRLAK